MDTGLSKLEQFLAAVEAAIADGSFVRLALRNPFGDDKTLVSSDIKPVMVKGALKLAFTAHYKTRDLHDNHTQADAIAAAAHGARQRVPPGVPLHHDVRPALRHAGQGAAPQAERADEQGSGRPGARPGQGAADRGGEALPSRRWG